MFREINLGATAIGTGINADPRYASLAVAELARLSGPAAGAGRQSHRGDLRHGRLRAVFGRAQADRGQAFEDLQRSALAVLRSARGIWRNPPAAVQAGSSIMPGKVNPVIPEVVSQVAYLVIGTRSHRDDVRRGRPASAQRVRADDRLFDSDLAAHADRRDPTL